MVINSLKAEWVDASFRALSNGGRFIELGKIDIWSKDKAANLRPDATYMAVTNSYVVDRWEYNLGFQPREPEVLELVVFDAAVNESRKGPIVAPPNPRMIRIDE